MDQPSTSKRSALTISTTGAPRPLHLPSRSLSSSPGLQTAPLFLPSTSSSPTSSHALADPPLTSIPRTAPRRLESRRQSSISYLPRDSPRSWSPRIPPQNNAQKRASVAIGAVTANHDAKEVRRNGAVEGGGKTEAKVLTLAEKHAPLLQFIAQKESKCLELRAQLAVHESELLALKQAWERIVRRDFGKIFNASAPSTSPSAPFSSTPSAPGNAQPASGLDSLLEGMPALGRLLALAPPASEPSPSLRTQSHAPRPSPFTKRQAHAHASSPSASTTTSSTTNTSSSVRYSQSSASSLEEEPDAKHASEETLTGKDKVVEELIVRDTGATPTFSPNPAFVSSKDTAASARGLRRRSRDAASLVSPEVEDNNRQRRTTNTLPPPASVPGIGSLAAMGVNMDISAAQGWMDSVGKRWSESGKTLSKSQKRASLLISDVSQSLFAALSPTSSPAPASSAPSSSWLGPGSGPRATPSPTPSRRSLLDEDDDMLGLGLGGVMLPDSPAPAPAKPNLKPKTTNERSHRSPAPVSTSANIASAQDDDDDDDDDWNW